MVFHSEDLMETKPCIVYEDGFCIINLEQDLKIEMIEIYTKNNEKKLLLEYFDNNNKWVEFQNYLQKSYENKICIEFANKFTLSKFRITDITNINFNSIKVYARKIKGLLIAARNDGFGARMMAVLGAMVLAKYTGYKFGFSWIKNFDSNDFNYNTKEVIVQDMKTEEEIFDKKFLDKHSYTKEFPRCQRGRFGAISLCNIKNNFIDEYWGYFISVHLAQRILTNAKINISKDYKEAWDNIKFNTNLEQVREFVKCLNFENFIAIHIRSGDIVYKDNLTESSAHYKRAMLSEFAMEIIERNINKSIILFGEDIKTLKEIKKYYKNKINIVLAQDLTSEKFNIMQNIMFDICLMSKAEEIYSGHSYYTLLASYISQGRDPKQWEYYFTENEQYEIMKKHFLKLPLHDKQKAFSAFFLYLKQRERKVKK